MIVYGDATQERPARAVLAHLSEALRALGGRPAGLARHAEVVALLIEAGELAQGVADAAFAARGQDAASPAVEATAALLLRVAQAVRDSWVSGFARLPPVPEGELRAAGAAALPGTIGTKRAEGFSYYALYPEAYLRAATPLAAGAPFRVVGIRSIGAPLGAVVAAALGAPAPVTLRPVGHPFRREVAVAPALAAAMLADPAARHAVVDEGPGLSGSSFGAVVGFLEARGAPPACIHLFPGHSGPPGAMASDEERARWDRLPRHVVTLDSLLLGEARPAHRLERWAADLLGEPVEPMEDLSGGAWRARRFPAEADWPPIHPQMERRKFLFRTARGAWLLKFAGLGRHGEAALARARRLHAAGLVPEPAGLLHGFLAERWVDHARPLDLGPAHRPRAVEHAGRYIGFRARHLPAGPAAGATAAALWRMARHNAAEALGEAAASGLDRWEPALDRLERRVRRVWTDNRMHAWEWLQRSDGTILKTDAVDHAAAHDLIGCQDAAWDVAGAAVELGLSLPERDRLLRVVEATSGAAVDPALLSFLTPCYLAFQLGYYRMAVDAAAGWPEERARAEAAAASYAARLQATLTGGGSG